MLRGEPAEVSGDYAVLTIMGPGAGAAEIDGWASATAAATMRAFGVDVIVPRDRIFAAAADLRARGGVCGGMGAHEAVRIAARRPRFGLDTDHRTIPNEAGWIETAVHLSKGCYRGQETVARVHNLGHPPRRLVFLHLDGSEDRLPAHGDPVSLAGEGGGAAGGGSAGGGGGGFVGAAARHHELGPIALALGKRTAPAHAPPLAAGIPAAQGGVRPPDTRADGPATLRRAKAVADEYIRLVGRLATAGMSGGGRAEVSVKPTAVGLDLAEHGEETARENIAKICGAARDAGTTVTLDMEERTRVEPTLRLAGQLRPEFPDLGCVIQSYLRRSPGDAQALAVTGSRGRLFTGAYSAAEGVAFSARAEVDRGHARCLRVLLGGPGDPMSATHHPPPVRIAGLPAPAP